MSGVYCAVNQAVSKPIQFPVVNAVQGSNFSVNTEYAEDGTLILEQGTELFPETEVVI